MLHVYVDGSGKPKSMYCYYVVENGNIKCLKGKELTNNQAEYLAIKIALEDLLKIDRELVIYSDSLNTLKQLNHEYSINNDRLRELALEIWSLISKYNAKVRFEWVDRRHNLAGKILGG